ncbi:hypothetical protein [Halorubrum salipaludis]|uniref:hypothetical protein n=1 Tax=Halorubrum salipaludis TaxID=2032630 RepID=UPI001E4BD8EE|nr:hypothetical protein [Halorubrum salipaludis]
MSRLGRALVSVPIGFVVGFLFAPDPTGLLPIAVGAVLSAVLTPVVYVGIGKASAAESA